MVLGGGVVARLVKHSMENANYCMAHVIDRSRLPARAYSRVAEYTARLRGTRRPTPVFGTGRIGPCRHTRLPKRDPGGTQRKGNGKPTTSQLRF